MSDEQRDTEPHTVLYTGGGSVTQGLGNALALAAEKLGQGLRVKRIVRGQWQGAVIYSRKDCVPCPF